MSPKQRAKDLEAEADQEMESARYYRKTGDLTKADTHEQAAYALMALARMLRRQAMQEAGAYAALTP